MIKPDKTFCEIEFVPLADLASDAGRENGEQGRPDVAIFGSSHGTPYKPGEPSHAADAPTAIRQALSWYSANPAQFDFDTMQPVFAGKRVVDCGDINGSLTDGAANRGEIKRTTDAILNAGAVPLLIGGDDSNPIPFIESFCDRGAVSILQIDAHIDWRDEVDGERLGYSSTMRRASEMPNVQNIVQIGARGPGSARQTDVDDALRWGAEILPARKLHNNGVEQSLGKIPDRANVVLAIDVDSLDPSVVPGVILPAYGGLTYHQLADIMLKASDRYNIVGINFVEFCPQRDIQGLGAAAVARLVSIAVAAAGRVENVWSQLPGRK